LIKREGKGTTWPIVKVELKLIRNPP